MVEFKAQDTILRITPKVGDLLPNRQLKCWQPGCSSIFSNTGNLQMHLKRHHRQILQSPPPEGLKKYFCPVTECLYYDSGKDSDKHFQCMKYLRQHYQKVHAHKSHLCEMCGKPFATEGLRVRHEADCGRLYKCDQCGWEYSSREALLTHAKRRVHVIDLKQTRGKPAPRLDNSSSSPVQLVKKLIATQDQSVQVDLVDTKKLNPTRKRKQSSYKVKTTPKKTKTIKEELPNGGSSLIQATATPLTLDSLLSPSQESPADCHESNLNHLSYVDDVEDPLETCFGQLSSTSLCDIETQTDNFSSAMLDQMLYNNMHTQTCDEFLLSELGLSDIQTQTNWPAGIDDDDDTAAAEPPSSTDIATIRNGYDVSGPHDVLVSTETQTSFTQCLLEYNDVSAGTNSNGITQHTQTCDTLLEGLFGGQESDLIANFQSTHTQT